MIEGEKMETRSGKKIRLLVCILSALLAFETVFTTYTFKAFAVSEVRIGQACCDERGKVKGGKAGDQTGRECCTGKWSYSSNKNAYNHWVYVFRAKNPKTAKKLAKKMLEACANDHVGYDQKIPDRYSFHEEAEKVGWDIKAITKNCETTCTSAMAVCLNAVGIPTRKIWTVNNVYADLKATQQFYILSSKKYTRSSAYLEPGDILLSGCHGAMVVESPNKPGAIKVDTNPDAVDTTPVFTVGKKYQLTTHLYVRKGAGKEYTVKFRDDLSDSAKKYLEEGSFAILNQGTVVKCKDCKGGWIKTKYGWICGQRDSYFFVEEYTGTEAQEAAYAAAKNPETTTAASTSTNKTTTTTTSSTKSTTTTTSKSTTTTKTTSTAKATTAKKTSTLVIKPGKDYTLNTDLYVRTGPGKKYSIKKRSQLTEDGKKHSAKGTNAILLKGTVVTCLEVKGNWMRIPSGWVCYKSGYIKK